MIFCNVAGKSRIALQGVLSRVAGDGSAGERAGAVGTMAVQALETMTDAEEVAHPGEGWTRLIMIPQCGMRAVNAMLAGLDEPFTTHLSMLEALARLEHL